MPAAHHDGGAEETELQKQEGLQPGEIDETSACRHGLWLKKTNHTHSLFKYLCSLLRASETPLSLSSFYHLMYRENNILSA